MRRRKGAAAAIVIVLISAALAAFNSHRHSEYGSAPATISPATSSLARSLFLDMRATSGINFQIPHPVRPLDITQTLGHGAALFDYDGDGLLDILLLGPDQVRLYHNDGNWRFTDVTSSSGLRQNGFWQGVSTGDYDNDGREDLYLCGYNCSALYHNDGNGHFTEVTGEAGLQVGPPDSQGVPEWRTSAAFVDVDGDGLLDLYVCEYAKFGPHTTRFCQDRGIQAACPIALYEPQKGRLFRNLGHGKFRDETEARGLAEASGRGLGVAIADYDGDGWIDIAVANDEMPGDLFHNKGHGYFEKTGAKSGTAFSLDGRLHGGMGIDWGDFDNTGQPGLLVATFENEDKNLYQNLGHGMFMDIGGRAGLAGPTTRQVGFGAKFLDYDNDGRLDIVITNGHILDNTDVVEMGTTYPQRSQLFHNNGSGTFQEVSALAGMAFTTPLVGRALCTGDIDNDGQEDILISNLEGQPLLLRNTCAHAGRWLTIKLVGAPSNRDGIGAQVSTVAGDLRQVRTVSTTGSFMSASDPRIHFGLGTHSLVDILEVRWPSGHKDVLHNLRTNQFYTVREGEGAAKARTTTP